MARAATILKMPFPQRYSHDIDGYYLTMHPASMTSDEKKGLFFLVVLSLALRTVLILLKDGVGTDEVLYLLVGKNVWEGKGFTLLGYPMTMIHPLLPIVTGFFSLFTDNLESGSTFVYVVFGTLTLVPFYLLVRSISGYQIAKIATSLLAVYSPLLLSFYWGSMTEPLYTFWMVLSLFTFHQAMESRMPSRFAISGMCFALLYLSRSEGFIFFLVFSLYLMCAHGIRKELYKKSFLVNLLSFVLCFLLISMPYPLFIKKHTGTLTLSGKIKLILLAGAMDITTREGYVGRLTTDGESFVNYEDLVKDKTVADMILENPKVLVGGSFLQIKNFFVTLVSWKVYPLFLMPFLILGIFHDPWDRERLKNELFLFLSCTPFLVFLSFLIWPRYLLPMTPILLIWTARGIYGLQKWMQQSAENIFTSTRAANSSIRAIPMVLVILPLVIILVAKPIKAKLLVQYPVEYKIAGSWMNENLPEDALILARKPEIAYYAKRLMHPLPNEDLPRVVHYARRNHIGYMVLDEFTISSRPQLRYLLEEDIPSEELNVLYSEKSRNGRIIKVFQIN